MGDGGGCTMWRLKQLQSADPHPRAPNEQQMHSGVHGQTIRQVAQPHPACLQHSIYALPSPTLQNVGAHRPPLV